MEFNEKIEQLKERVLNIKDNLQTEEATKNALIMPMLNILGFDVFNPLEVVPEFVADTRFKKDEKVDYAILKDGKPIILIECKKIENSKLDIKKHGGQLFKYFTACKAKFIILTNGIIYKFFSDIEEQNILDKEPFFIFNLIDYKENHLETLAEFKKENFDIDKIFKNAGDLKNIKQFEQVIENEYLNPSEDFIRYLINKTEGFNGRITEKVVEKHKKTTIEAFNLFMSRVMKTSLDFNLANQEKNEDNKNDKKKNEIVTTPEELEGYAFVKSLLKDVVDLNRVTYRDNASYFNVLLDNNILKTICRLYFNTKQKYIAFLINKKENKIPIEKVEDVLNFKENIIEKVKEFI